MLILDGICIIGLGFGILQNVIAIYTYWIALNEIKVLNRKHLYLIFSVVFLVKRIESGMYYYTLQSLLQTKRCLFAPQFGY